MSETDKTQEEVVNKKAHDEVMQDLLKQKATAKELNAKLAAYEAEKEDLKVRSLKEKEEWKKLAEMREKEATDAKKLLEDRDKAVKAHFKSQAVKSEAIKMGIVNADDIDLLSFDDDVVIETTSTGKFSVLGADKYVDRLKATRPNWFENKAPSVDSNIPRTEKGKKMDMKAILKLQKEGKQADYEAALKNYKKRG